MPSDTQPTGLVLSKRDLAILEMALWRFSMAALDHAYKLAQKNSPYKPGAFEAFDLDHRDANNLRERLAQYKTLWPSIHTL